MICVRLDHPAPVHLHPRRHVHILVCGEACDLQGEIPEYLDHVTCRHLDRFVRIRDLGIVIRDQDGGATTCDVAAKGSIKEDVCD